MRTRGPDAPINLANSECLVPAIGTVVLRVALVSARRRAGKQTIQGDPITLSRRSSPASSVLGKRGTADPPRAEGPTMRPCRDRSTRPLRRLYQAQADRADWRFGPALREAPWRLAPRRRLFEARTFLLRVEPASSPRRPQQPHAPSRALPRNNCPTAQSWDEVGLSREPGHGTSWVNKNEGQK